MNELNQPKGFGEILDLTFRLCKNRFSDFFMILLIVVGPVYLLQAIIMLFSGSSFFRESGGGSAWYEEIVSGLDESADSINWGADVGTLLLGLISSILLPVALGAVLFGVNRLKNNQEFSSGTVIKQAFSRFWGIFGGSLLFGIIAFGMVFVPLIFIIIISVLGAAVTPAAGIILGVLLFFGVGLVVVLLLTRWSLYLGSVVVEKDAPGLGRSWNLTRGRTWKTLGMFIIIYLITWIIQMAVGGTMLTVLGDSVLYTMIANLVSLFTNMIFFVAYAIIYHDFKTRHDADNLKEMIDDYDGVKH